MLVEAGDLPKPDSKVLMSSIFQHPNKENPSPRTAPVPSPSATYAECKNSDEIASIPPSLVALPAPAITHVARTPHYNTETQLLMPSPLLGDEPGDVSGQSDRKRNISQLRNGYSEYDNRLLEEPLSRKVQRPSFL